MTAAVRLTLRDKVLGWFESNTSPATVKDVVAVFGTGGVDALEGLVFDGLVQRRKTFTKGRPYQHIAKGRAWPPHEVTPAQATARKAEKDRERRLALKKDRPVAEAVLKLERALEEMPEAQREIYRPWPFYSEKFLPYVKFMDAHMRRRYLRTAKIYGHKAPELD